MMFRRILTIAGASAAAFSGAAIAQTNDPDAGHKVIELRQYKLTRGAQDEFIALFDREFVDTQEAVGMRLIGQFHDHDRRDRFTWVREFSSMSERARELDAFYNGPVWQRFKGLANPMLDDNDDVLLLREARDGSGFGALGRRAAVGVGVQRPDTYFAVIEYLWKDPNEGFSTFFLDHVRPLLGHAGLPVLGVYVPEEKPNNFPRLPVRSEKKILVWFTKTAGAEDFEAIWTGLASTSAWKQQVAGALEDSQERPPQVLRLDPTPRSALQ